jgi:hypothetical protein
MTRQVPVSARADVNASRAQRNRENDNRIAEDTRTLTTMADLDRKIAETNLKSMIKMVRLGRIDLLISISKVIERFRD